MKIYQSERTRKQAEALKEFYRNNPQAKKAKSQALNGQPSSSQKKSLGLVRRYQNPEAREQTSIASKRVRELHPELSRNHSLHMRQLHADNPLIAIKQASTLSQYYINHPEAKETLRNGAKLSKPEVRAILYLRKTYNLSYALLGELFDVEGPTANAICIQHSWTHLTELPTPEERLTTLNILRKHITTLAVKGKLPKLKGAYYENGM